METNDCRGVLASRGGVAGGVAWLLALAMTLGTGCVGQEQELGGETNFLRPCQVREDCGPGEHCSEERVCEAAYAMSPPPPAIQADAGAPSGPCVHPALPDGLDGSLGEFVGTWSGELFGVHSLSGSPDITLRLEGEPLSGTIRFGDAADIPPVGDPDVGYLVDGKALDVSRSDWLHAIPLIAGFEYTLSKGMHQDGEVVLSFSPSEPWSEWCALQTPYDQLPQWEADLWSCARGAGSYVPTQGDGLCTGYLTDIEWWQETGGYRSDRSSSWVEDCGRAALCDIRVCECTPESCQLNTLAVEVIQLRSTDDGLEGSALCGGTEIRGLMMMLERR